MPMCASTTANDATAGHPACVLRRGSGPTAIEGVTAAQPHAMALSTAVQTSIVPVHERQTSWILHEVVPKQRPVGSAQQGVGDGIYHWPSGGEAGHPSNSATNRSALVTGHHLTQRTGTVALLPLVVVSARVRAHTSRAIISARRPSLFGPLNCSGHTRTSLS